MNSFLVSYRVGNFFVHRPYICIYNKGVWVPLTTPISSPKICCKNSFSKSRIKICILGTNRYQDRWKWFLPASRSSLNPPGPSEKPKNLSFRTRIFTEKFGKFSLLALLIPFWGGPPRGDGPVPRAIACRSWTKSCRKSNTSKALTEGRAQSWLIGRNIYTPVAK